MSCGDFLVSVLCRNCPDLGPDLGWKVIKFISRDIMLVEEWVAACMQRSQRPPLYEPPGLSSKAALNGGGRGDLSAYEAVVFCLMGTLLQPA